MANAAQIVARRLFQAGCRHAFGIPGGEVLTVMDALVEAGIRFELCKQENAGGFMAEGTYHVTGAPGILLATLGPGAANAVNVVANAEQDRVPLVFITGCVDPAKAAGYTHQVFDHGAVLKPITKASYMLSDGAVARQVDKALAIAMEGRPGPVHLDLPIGLAGREQPEPPPPGARRGAAAAPAPGADLEAARRALAESGRPLLIAGLEVLAQGADAAVAKLARGFSIPVITTYKAKGVLPETDPLALGGAGLSPLADRHLMPLIGTADLILLAGYDPVEMRDGWCEPWDPETVPVIEFSAAPNHHGVHRTRLGFFGDIAAGLEVLAADLAPVDTWSNGAPVETRRALAEAFPADEAWGPAAVVDEVQRLLPEDAIATVDTGAHRILLSQVWRCRRPRSLLQSTSFGTMGCGLPLGIGAKLAAPERPVVVFTGDAGLEMVLGELATLRDLKLPLVIVVFVDSSLALIELKQRDRGLPNRGVDFGATDFPAVARALGGKGVAVRDRAALAEALQAGLADERFTLIAAEIGPRAYDGRF
ncbi:MAG: thiamine pyrophosphate-binding protein [Rhodospirillales bacterium]|nr:thiamine pyrophosphate-binding protein [Rhodospirillales bacterium]MDH3965612.1 thiamine pyrophosphate-binding protein [Rhodospirillales bacterium]